MKKFSIYSLLLVVLLSSACAKKSERSGIDPKSGHEASKDIKDSFQAEPSATSALESKSDLNIADQAHVSIQKTALNKEFLLTANMLSQTPTPMFSSLQSRVVSFIQRDQKVYLLDVTKINTVGADTNIPQNILLAEFPILKETETNLVIDFNAGMKQIFTVADMYGSDDLNSATDGVSTSQVRISYLDDVQVRDNALFIRQVAQIETRSAKGTTTANPLEVRYQIKPYLPDSSFEPVISPGFKKVGYFEANPLLLADGSTRVYAMKWNEKKPIKFAISANTPEKFRGLVKSALLYWNKILGDQAIEVVQLEDKAITAPNFDTNIIQWADWDAAGFAFADAQVDPRSGQVTSAQIFFPSAFTEANVPKRIRLTEGSKRPVFGLKGFSSSRLCQRDLLKDLSTMDASEVTPAAMDKAMRDYVYEVIAHELGHVLGLRHNFAGNLAANYDYKDRPTLIMNYYKEMKAPEGIVDSSSVMEYSRFEESAWNGDLFQKGGKALAYDEMAISYLYLKKPLPETNRPIFCTDSDIEFYADCNMSDAGRSVISAATGAYQINLKSLAARLVNQYVSSSKLADESGIDLIPVSDVNLNATSLASTLGNDFAKFVSLMKAGTKFIAVRSYLLPILAPELETVKMIEKEYLSAEVMRLGGLENLIQAVPQNYDTDLIAKFTELLDNPLYNSGVLRNGDKYEFTADEKRVMIQQVSLFAKQVKEKFILNEIKALSGENFAFSSYGQEAPEEKAKWTDSVLTDELAALLLKRFEKYTLDQTSDKLSSEIVLKDGTKTQVELPVYVYSQPVRLAAVGLLSNGHEAIDWAYAEKLKAADDIKAELDLVGDQDKIEMTALNRKTLKWILNNKQLESELPN
jgi:hypothetical protein